MSDEKHVRQEGFADVDLSAAKKKKSDGFRRDVLFAVGACVVLMIGILIGKGIESATRPGDTIAWAIQSLFAFVCWMAMINGAVIGIAYLFFRNTLSPSFGEDFDDGWKELAPKWKTIILISFYLVESFIAAIVVTAVSSI